MLQRFGWKHTFSSTRGRTFSPSETYYLCALLPVDKKWKCVHSIGWLIYLFYLHTARKRIAYTNVARSYLTGLFFSSIPFFSFDKYNHYIYWRVQLFHDAIRLRLLFGCYSWFHHLHFSLLRWYPVSIYAQCQYRIPRFLPIVVQRRFLWKPFQIFFYTYLTSKDFYA